jgi:hypothetical protein
VILGGVDFKYCLVITTFVIVAVRMPVSFHTVESLLHVLVLPSVRDFSWSISGKRS